MAYSHGSQPVIVYYVINEWPSVLRNSMIGLYC